MIKTKCDLEKPLKYRDKKQNTIDVHPIGIQISMVFSTTGVRRGSICTDMCCYDAELLCFSLAVVQTAKEKQRRFCLPPISPNKKAPLGRGYIMLTPHKEGI